MKQLPNNLKFKKYHKVNFFFAINLEKKNFYPINGEYCLQCLESGKIQFKHIEASRRTIKRGLNKHSKLWIKLFTNIPITKKPLAVRMGKGKGNVSHWIAILKKGQIIFEISGITFNKAKFLLTKSKTKLPIRTKIIKLIY